MKESYGDGSDRLFVGVEHGEPLRILGQRYLKLASRQINASAHDILGRIAQNDVGAETVVHVIPICVSFNITHIVILQLRDTRVRGENTNKSYF